MARNTGSGTRKGQVKDRSQVFNPMTGHYIKRDTTTGQFIEVKKDGTRFKGVREEKVIIKPNPKIKKSTALKAERAVLALSKRRGKLV